MRKYKFPIYILAIVIVGATIITIKDYRYDNNINIIIGYVLMALIPSVAVFYHFFKKR